MQPNRTSSFWLVRITQQPHPCFSPAVRGCQLAVGGAAPIATVPLKPPPKLRCSRARASCTSPAAFLVIVFFLSRVPGRAGPPHGQASAGPVPGRPLLSRPPRSIAGRDPSSKDRPPRSKIDCSYMVDARRPTRLGWWLLPSRFLDRRLLEHELEEGRGKREEADKQGPLVSERGRELSEDDIWAPLNSLSKSDSCAIKQLAAFS